MPAFAKIGDAPFEQRRGAGRNAELLPRPAGLQDGPLSLLPAIMDSFAQRLPARLRQALPQASPTDRSRLSSVEDFFRYTEEEGASLPSSLP